MITKTSNISLNSKNDSSSISKTKVDKQASWLNAKSLILGSFSVACAAFFAREAFNFRMSEDSLNQGGFNSSDPILSNSWVGKNINTTSAYLDSDSLDALNCLSTSLSSYSLTTFKSMWLDLTGEQVTSYAERSLKKFEGVCFSQCVSSTCKTVKNMFERARTYFINSPNLWNPSMISRSFLRLGENINLDEYKVFLELRNRQQKINEEANDPTPYNRVVIDLDSFDVAMEVLFEKALKQEKPSMALELFPHLSNAKQSDAYEDIFQIHIAFTPIDYIELIKIAKRNMESKLAAYDSPNFDSEREIFSVSRFFNDTISKAIEKNEIETASKLLLENWFFMTPRTRMPLLFEIIKLLKNPISKSQLDTIKAILTKMFKLSKLTLDNLILNFDLTEQERWYFEQFLMLNKVNYNSDSTLEKQYYIESDHVCGLFKFKMDDIKGKLDPILFNLISQFISDYS